jgi:hypothetical protein
LLANGLLDGLIVAVMALVIAAIRPMPRIHLVITGANIGAGELILFAPCFY